tara:strand:- start:10 stop:1050 length:1041 start_codon:yes stop_codon:yes gene_type:complete
MAYTTINKSTDYFNTVLYSGNGSTQSITGVGFQPDWTWIKNRNLDGYNHNVYDAVRGVTKLLKPSGTNAEITNSTSLTAFGSDGFTLGGTGTGEINQSNGTYASWNWLANGQGSSNTDGTINSTYTSASTTSGFSIVTYTGTGANATVGHGLGVAPTTVWIKQRSGTEGFYTYWKAIGAANQMTLAGTDASAAGGVLFNSTDATSTVFSVGTHGSTNASGSTYVAYCFAPITGFSSINSYTGNGNADGVFQYLGFKPAWVMIKKTSGTGSWWMFDNKRLGYNPSNSRFYTNDTATEATSTVIDFLSNGFKFRSDDGELNASGGTYVYIAFASSPLVSSNNVPANAR